MAYIKITFNKTYKQYEEKTCNSRNMFVSFIILIQRLFLINNFYNNAEKILVTPSINLSNLVDFSYSSILKCLHLSKSSKTEHLTYMLFPYRI